MKNLFTRLMLVAVVAMGFVACQNGLEEVTILPNEAEKVTISITTESEVESRTAIDEANKSFVWSAGDKIMVFQDAVAVESEEAVIDGTKATFKASFDVADGTFAYNAIYPSSAYITDSFKLETTDVEPIVRVTTPSTQTSTADSYDPEADLLIAQPTSATQEEATTMSMSFKRLVAIGKMTLKGLNTDEPINSVTISAPGKVLAGRSSFNYATGQVVEYGYNSYGESSLTIKYEEALTNNSPVFFTCLPCEFVAGDTFTVSAVCGDTTFTREVTIPEGGNSLLFTDGDLTTFTVNMSSATETSSFSVKTGDYVIMVQYTESSTVYNKMMKVNNSTSTTAYQYYTDYTGKTDVNSITTDIENIWTITNNGNGTYYIQPKDSEYYLSWRNGGNTACLSTDALALSITENGDYVKIVVNETTERVLSYNSSSPRFAFYKGTQKQDLLLIPAEVDATPNFTVSPTEQSIGAEGGNIKFTVDAINGAVVTAKSSADWLRIDDTFNATVDPNETAEARSATITFSAEGCDDVPVVITQAAKPAEVTGVWTLVTDASTLAVGDQIIIAAANYDFALSTTQNDNNRGKAAITKSGNTVSFNNDVQILTVEAGTKADTFAFNTGNGYLYAASSGSNYLRTETTLSDNSSWDIKVDATGVATIIAQGTNTRNVLLYNSSNSIFSCYASGQQDVAIYYLGGEPDITPRFTVTPTEQSIGAEGGDIQFTVTSYNGAVVTAESSDTTWLTIDDTFKATAEANNSEQEREATITFSADGCDDVVVVTVSQEGKSTVSTYTKITSAAELTEGEYIIVYEDGSNAYVFSGVDAVNGYNSASITDNTISGTFADGEVTIAAMEGGYSLKVAKGYMSGTSGSNKLNFGTTASANTFEFNANGTVKIISNTSVFTFNHASNQLRFRYYKSASYASMGAVTLYKKN